MLDMILVIKIFSSLGINTPIVLVLLILSPLAISFTLKSRALIAFSIVSLFISRTLPPFMYFEMVAMDKPVYFATSFIVDAILRHPYRETFSSK